MKGLNIKFTLKFVIKLKRILHLKKRRKIRIELLMEMLSLDRLLLRANLRLETSNKHLASNIAFERGRYLYFDQDLKSPDIILKLILRKIYFI